MTIREEFDYTFVDPYGVMLCLEARIGRGNENLWLRLLSPSSDQVVLIKPTREQWLELRATINHMLDSEDVTAISTVEAKDSFLHQEVPTDLRKLPTHTAAERAHLERWLDKHTLDDTDLNDPPSPEEVT